MINYKKLINSNSSPLNSHLAFPGADAARAPLRPAVEASAAPSALRPPSRPPSRAGSVYVPGGMSTVWPDVADPATPAGPVYTSYSLTHTGEAATPLENGSSRRQSRSTQQLLDDQRGNTPGPKQHQRTQDDYTGFSSSIMNDRFGHYNRPPSRPASRSGSRAPSRDRSVDRLASRGQTPVPPELINPRSRAPSAQRCVLKRRAGGLMCGSDV